MDSNLLQTRRFKSIFLFCIFLFSSLIYGQATVFTDRDDYVPGQYVIVTGSGWLAGETVQLHFDETPQVCTSDHNRYTVADEYGNINYSQFLINERHLGVTFVLTATGQTSGLSANTIFTDGNVRVKTNVSTAGLSWNVFAGTACSGSSTSSGTGTATTSNGTTFTKLNNTTNTSLRITAPANAANGSAFSSWSGPAGEFTVDASNPRIICIPATANSGIQDFTINYVSCIAPTIVTQPTNEVITYGDNANFSVIANGSATLTYQWRLSIDNGLNYNDIVGANSSSLTVNSPTVSMSGYLYRVVITNGCGTITSNAASLTVNKADANIVVNGYNGVYDGIAHGATGSATGIGGAVLSGLNLGNSFTNVPGGIAIWTFTNPNYLDESGNVNITITKANATIVVTPYSVTYDANPHTSSGSATGVEGEALAGLDLSGTTHTNAGTYNSDPWSFTDVTGNYNNDSGSVDNYIGKANASIVITPYSGVYDSLLHTATGTATGVSGMNLNAGLSFVTSYRNVPGGTTVWNFNGGINYNNDSGSASVTISQRDLIVSATGINKIYDGTTVATVNLSSDKIIGDALTPAYANAQFVNPNVGTWVVNVNGITISGADKDNYNLTNTTAVTSASITSATTALNLQLSAASVRYMDNLTFTAKIVPLNSGSPLTGSVKFTVNGVDYGSYPVVPIPGAVDGSVQAMVIKQIVNLPGNYIVKAEFLSSNANYSGSYQEKTLLVIPRNASPYNATGFYTGDLFAWTTGPNTSTATLTMTAVIKDNNVPTGDVRSAKVSFYIVNGGTMSPIASAQNLPVGLIDVSDGSVGSASAIVQLNIGSANAASFQIAVKVTGAYENNPWSTLSQCIVTVTKPVPGGYIVGGGNLLNSNSLGYVKGASGQFTGFQFDVQFNNKLTNPQGKAVIYVSSYNKPDGTLDSKLHTYIITTNAISLLNITLPKAQFSSKANIVEQLENGTTVSLEGGAAFQMAMTDSGNSLSQKTLAITLNRKAGGVWFSSNWNASQSKTVEQILNGGSLQVRTASGSAKEEVITSDEPITDTGFKVKIYPNPSSYEFVFENQNAVLEPVIIKLFDTSGKFVKEIVKNNEQQFTFGYDLPRGVYLAIISQGLESKTMKLIKE
ncbi:MAG TPA: YDG domain-containing protein [Flavobacterium sp.]|nr:YDG domain-containing protein [Flavobacterium sp.]